MKMIHSMIRVRDLETSIKFYETAFGLRVKERAEFTSFTLVYLGNEGGFELELTWNADRSAPYDLGNGYGHLAFVADDLQGCHARLERAGMSPQPIKSMDHDGRPFARFFFISDPDGYKIEVLENSGRFQ
jgi:lactoylglutathione lyase